MVDPNLNKAEVWIAEHSVRILLAFAMIMIPAAIAFVFLIASQERTEQKIDVLRPQVTKIVRAANVCERSSLRNPRESRYCARRLEVAFLDCRLYASCRAVLLAAVLSPGRPPAARTPSRHRHSPAPASGGKKSGHRHGTLGGSVSPPKSRKPHQKGHSAHPQTPMQTPTPSPSPAPEHPGPPQPIRERVCGLTGNAPPFCR